ncbi:hypothetical protein ACQHIV_21835 [Kribbella sp. GL6]|uniref:hypothetical protein n=1 Tax=Kribbella sp. GL6 TaxID=3419765 RepID=UPI003D08DC4D
MVRESPAGLRARLLWVCRERRRPARPRVLLVLSGELRLVLGVLRLVLGLLLQPL